MSFANKPAVSVVLPVYNAEASVASAIESIRNQSLHNWELIVIDDGSVDSSHAILSRFAAADSRIRLISEPHRGIVAALQRGIEQAHAPLIARMDADDYSHPDRLRQQVSFLAERPDIGLAGSLVAFGGDALRAAGYALHVEWINSIVSPEQIGLNRFIESPFAHPSVMFRRALLENHGGYCEGPYPEDYELWLRWLDAGVSMSKVASVLLTWHDPTTRLSRSDARYSTEAFYACKAVYLSRWLKRFVAPERPIWVWGAGRPTRKRAELLTEHGVTLSGYIDIDPTKIGRTVAGRPIVRPDDLSLSSGCFVLGYVAKRGARELARSHLLARHFVEGRDFLMAA